MNETIN